MDGEVNNQTARIAQDVKRDGQHETDKTRRTYWVEQHETDVLGRTTRDGQHETDNTRRTHWVEQHETDAGDRQTRRTV